MARRTKSDVTIMIAEAAYYRAEKRNFEPGYELTDWLEAEQEILSFTKNSAKAVTASPIKAPTVVTPKKQTTKTTSVAPAKQIAGKGQTASQTK